MNVLEYNPLNVGAASIRVRVKSFDQTGRVEQFQSFPVLVGRERDADLRLEDRFVSHVHCLLNLVNGVFHVQDLESRNGTWLNGERISIATFDQGDWIDLGGTRLTITAITGEDETGMDT